MKRHEIIVQEEGGYILNPRRSFFAVIVPEDTVNLVVNPECADTFGYYGNSCTVSATADKQRRGAKSLYCAPAQAGGVVYHRFPGALAANKAHTFSVDILGTGRYQIYFGDVNGAQLTKAYEFDTPLFWDRFTVTAVVPASTRSVCIKSVDGTAFYADGFQCEQKAYATTFVSGNREAPADTAVPGRLTYGWMGAIHRSMSYRTRFVSTGGRPLPLSDLGLDVTDFSGFGFMAPELITAKLALRPGTLYMGRSVTERQFTIGGYLQSDRIVDLLAKRGAVGTALLGNQQAPAPITLHVQFFDDLQAVTEVLEIECIYQGGLEGVVSNLYQEKATITFQAWRPAPRLLGNRAKAMDITAVTMSSPVNVLYQDGTVGAIPDGGYSWNYDTRPFRLAVGPDGLLYTVRYDDILRYSSAGWTAVVHVANALIRDIAAGPDGYIYFIYEDDQDGAPTGHIKRYDPIANTVDSMSNTVFICASQNLSLSRLRVDRQRSRVYVCGNFTSMTRNSQALVGRYGVFDGVAFLELSNNTWYDFPHVSDNPGGEDWIVYDVVVDGGGRVWITGQFTFGGQPQWGSPWGTMYFDIDNNWKGWFALTNTDTPATVTDLRATTLWYDDKTGLIIVGGDFDRFVFFSQNVKYVYPTGGCVAYIDTVSGFVWGIGKGLRYAPGAGAAPFVSDIAGDGAGTAYVVGAFDQAVNLTGGEQEAPVTAKGVAVLDIQKLTWQTSPITAPGTVGTPTLPAYADSVIVAPAAMRINAYLPVVLPSYSEWYNDMETANIVSMDGAVIVSHTNQGSTYRTPVTEVTIPAGAQAIARLEIRGSCLVKRVINATTGRVLQPNLTVNANEVVTISLAPDPAWVRSTTRGEIGYPNLGKDSFPDLGLTPGKNSILVDLVNNGGAAVYLYWAEEYPAVDVLAGRYAV